MNKQSTLPQCVGLILDGNRRYAKERGFALLRGHETGLDALERILEALFIRGIAHVACYAFSTENWQRSEEEVSGLMKLVTKGLLRLEQTLIKSGRRDTTAIRCCGQLHRLTQEAQEMIAGIEERNPAQSTSTLWILLSYGGHAEIVHAARQALARGEEITEESIEQNLWTAGMPAPDMIIRTAGEERLSGFLLWKSSYSELFFTKTLWPAFTEQELDELLTQFAHRKRNFGK